MSELSEEEIIDNIKFVLRDLTADRYNVNFVNSIKALLALYQKEKEKNKKAIKYILKKQSLQYKYALSKIECEKLLEILKERN